jgi:Dolichyl-phosphate-mannose-protein mannosyltransferase
MFKRNDIKHFDWPLMTILVTAFSLRVWGIDFGLPQTESRPDETIIVTHALGFFSGDFNPHFFAYPTFYQYLLFTLYIFYFIVGKMFGKYSSISNLLEEFAIDSTNFYLIDRCASLLLGTATCFVVYKIAEKLFDRKTALISSLFLSLAYLHVRDSHFGTVDVAVAFFVMLSLLFTIKSYEDKTIKNYMISGLFAGLAISTKYNGLLITVSMFIVHFFNILDERNERKNSDTVEFRTTQFTKILQYSLLALAAISLAAGFSLNPEILIKQFNIIHISSTISLIQEVQKFLVFGGFCLATLSMILPKAKFLSDFLDQRFIFFVCIVLLVFILGTPFAILDVKKFTQDFLYTARGLQTGHGLILGIGWWYHARYTLQSGLGLGLFFASLAGCVILGKLSFRKAAILLSFPLIYYIAIGKGYSVFLRYMMPVIPFVCIAAAIFVVHITARLNRYPQLRLMEKPITLSVITFIISQSIHNIVLFDSLLAKRDNRLIATNWVQSHTKENSTFYQTGYNPGHLDLDKSPQTLLKTIVQVGGAKLPLDHNNILVSRNIKAYEEWDYDEKLNKFVYNEYEKSKFPDYIIKQEYPLPMFAHIPDGIKKILNNNYALKASFIAINANNNENWFDRIDAFYIPFSGFKEVQRPGPNLYIYERK